MRDESNKRRRELLLACADCCVILLCAAILILPLWRIEYLKNWGSIDSTFIADARFLKEHWPHPPWQPLWYCGTRFDYIYPPALRYGTAILSMLLGVSTARAYHLYTAVFYTLGSVGVYALVRAGSGSRLWGWIGAAATATLSPSFLFLRSFREDALDRMPQRLNVLVKWGEGPHMSSLALLPLALGFVWLALRTGGRGWLDVARAGVPSGPATAPAFAPTFWPALSRLALRTEGRGWLALAAVFAAAVVSTNFYGALALAALYPLLVWSLWITHRDHGVLARAAAVAALAYGLTAFWLTPSYLRVTMENLQLVAQPGKTWARWVGLAVALLFAWASGRLARGRKAQAWRVFLCGASLFLLLEVAGNYYFGFRIAGEPHRFVPELDLVLILLAVEVLRSFAAAGARWKQAVVLLLVMVSFAAGYRYLARPWKIFDADPDYRGRMEFQMADWIAHNLPGARTFATGTLRLWFNAWHNEQQVGGGSEQGLVNGELALAQWQVTKDPQPGRDLEWLEAVGADAVAMHERASDEILQEFVAPGKFAGRLPVLYDDGHGDVIYRVPRRFAAHARVVEKGRVESLRPIPVSDNDRAELAAYVAAVENGPDRAVEMRWEAPNLLRLRANLRAGETLLVQESYDPAWRAIGAAGPLHIRRDAAGFMLVDAPPGDQEVRMLFLQGRAGWEITAGSIALVLWLGWSSRRRRGIQ